MSRSTVVVPERTLLGEVRLAAARSGTGSGLQVIPMAALAGRLAGGFLSTIERDPLGIACGEVLADLADADLGDLAAIRDLPGLRATLATSLERAWRAGYDLAEHSAEHPRLAAMARIEQAVVLRLPPAQLRYADLAERAMARLNHAATVLGPVAFRGFPDLDPCWRPLVTRLAKTVAATWDAGPLPPPAWLVATTVEVRLTEAAKPEVRTFSCATAQHEAVEALRWVRSLLASGVAKPQEVAIAAASPAMFDDAMLAAVEESSLPIHFADGRSVLQTPHGQTAAALADVLLRGVAQGRVRRLKF